MADDDLMLDFDGDVAFEEKEPKKSSQTKELLFAGADDEEDGGSGLESFMDDMGLQVDGAGVDLSKPWMAYHQFKLIKRVEDVRALIDDCLEHGNCALDLETEGFDNRIEYDATGAPYTRHKIVGYCIGLKGQGYYIPVRHRWETLYDSRGPNVDDIVGTEQEIKRLCLASQPVIEPESAKYDPLGSKDLLEPPKVVIKFWHAKFDQEFLYPITGIDWWHPDSFEDGMLAAYTIQTDGIHGLKENAAGAHGAVGKLTVKDVSNPEIEYPYEMIKFRDLFPKGTKTKDMGFYNLSPSEDGEGWNCVLYGCSDGICTDLLCDQLCPTAKGKKYKGFYRLEKQVVQAVRIMERCRVQINKEEISTLLLEAEAELEKFEKKIIQVASKSGFDENFNPSSAAQLANLLFGDKHLNINPKPETTSEGQYKTDEKTLETYIDTLGAKCPDVISWVIKHRQINKVKGTYLENLARNTDELGQLRLNFKQSGAATGRFTAPKGDADHGFAGVPIQGIPAKNDPKKPQVAHSLRRMFVARDGYVMAKIDYASQELRIAASISGEEKWINEYVKEIETGIPADLHFMTAQAFFPGLKKGDPDFKLKRGMGKCVHPDTRLKVGPLGKAIEVAIKDLGSFGDPDTFVDAPKGLLVDGRPVKALYNGGVKPMVRIVTSHGSLTCSENHRLVLVGGSLKRAADLAPGEELHPHCDYTGRHFVVSTAELGDGPCLDITMDTEEHLYRANGILTHNTANFALVYGGGVGAVQRATGCDEVEGARLLKAFHESVPKFSTWVDQQHDSVKKLLGVRTGFGRFISVPDANISAEDILQRNLEKQERDRAKDPSIQITKMAKGLAWKDAKRIRAACERKSTNYPIQGCKNFNAWVLTRDGQKKIGDLYQSGGPFEVWVGDQWAPAIALDMGPCQLAEIRLNDGTVDECDTRHKLLVVTDKEYTWVDYSDLKPGMAIATALCEPLDFNDPPVLPRVEHHPKARYRFELKDPNQLWYWLGRYMGDGCLGQGVLQFCFGDHESSAIQQCRAFWSSCGIETQLRTHTRTPHLKESTRHQVAVQSIDLYNWLLKLGLKEGASAHTKRVPPCIFSETLSHRRSFLRGLMDSDGHKHGLPRKVDGNWETDKKGNPYNLHLCQRPLLVDVKRLLRTVGVESTLRGPYRSGKNKAGGDTTSYRLDIQRRMFESNVLGNQVRLPRFHDMDAPKFLVDEFLTKGPFKKAAFQNNESAYNLYLSLKGGGQVGVYTLKYLCQLLGVTLESPIYGFKRLESKTALGRDDHTYTLSVAHPLHRFEADGVITKNSGADILKISLVFLIKELHIRGWLKNGGDDSVRLVMTVHDEVVFEIRRDRVAEAVPVIKKIMEYPSTLAKWTVPLIAEPEIGDSWNAKLDWISMLNGDKDHPVPEWLQGQEVNTDPDVVVLSKPGSSTEGSAPKTKVLETTPQQSAAGEEKAPSDLVPEDDLGLSDEDLAAPKKPLSIPVPKKPVTDHKEYAVFHISSSVLMPGTVSGVYAAIQAAKAEAHRLEKLSERVPIELQDVYGNVLVDHKDGVLVYPPEFGRKLREANLGSEEFELFDV